MLSAPLFERAQPHRRPPDADDAEYARKRLTGTIWARGFAPLVYRALLRTGRLLARAGVSADALTLSSLVLSMASGVLAALGHFVLAALFLLLSGACDALDGVVARANSKATSFGALLDSTIDRLADGFPLLGVLVFYADRGALVAVPALAMMGAFIVSYVRARAESLGASLPALYMRRAERVVLLFVLFLLGPLSIPGISLPAPVLLLGVALLGVLSFAGAVSALRSARLALSAPRGMGFSEPSE